MLGALALYGGGDFGELSELVWGVKAGGNWSRVDRNPRLALLDHAMTEKLFHGDWRLKELNPLNGLRQGSSSAAR